MGHAARQLVQLDCILDQLEVLLRVVLLDHHGGLFIKASFEAVVRLAVDAAHVHFEGLLVVLRVLVAVSSLLIQVFRLIPPVLLRIEKVAEEAPLQCLVGLSTQLCGLHHEIDTHSLHHFFFLV